MKQFITIICLTLSHFGFAQSSDIQIYRNPEEVKGLIRVEEVSAKAMKTFGKQEKLRAQAIEMLKEEAREINATAVLIHKDEWALNPLNNVYLVGVAYRAPKPGELKSEPEEDYVAKLKKLKELLDSEIITQEEFDKEKAEILSKN